MPEIRCRGGREAATPTSSADDNARARRKRGPVLHDSRAVVGCPSTVLSIAPAESVPSPSQRHRLSLPTQLGCAWSATTAVATIAISGVVPLVAVAKKAIDVQQIDTDASLTLPATAV